MARDEGKKRRLPDWLCKNDASLKATNNVESQQDETITLKRRTLPNCFHEGFDDTKLPLLHFKGKIVYSYHSDECNFICEELMREKLMGFDIEWKVSYVKGGGSRKTALIQLCPSETTCYLFQLSRMRDVPVMLKSLLEDETIIKTGVGIQGDVEKLARDFDVFPRNIIDLSAMANKTLKSNENWRLTGLVMNLFKQQLNKDNIIRCSDWETVPLSNEQKIYAASDAYAGLIVYKKLDSMKSK